jgi:cysteinyl-tRNA synthetase
VDGEKMSKSKGNFFTLRDLAARGYDMRAIRYMLLSVHYRKPLNFTLEGLSQAAAALGRLDDLALRLEATAPHPAVDGGELSARAAEVLQGMLDALDADLNTAGALGHLFDLVRETHTAIDAGKLGKRDPPSAREALGAFERIFGIRPGQRADLNAEIEALIRKRVEARARKDFAAADRIRDDLLGRGIILEDTPQGVRWKRKGV